MLRRNILRGCCALVGLVSPVAQAAVDVWDNNPGGNWENGANWADNSPPGNNDSATFNLSATYTTTFAANPVAIEDLTISAGNVTFQSSGGARTLSVNSASGDQDVTITGGSTLTLGTAGNALHLTVGDELVVWGDAALYIGSGSQVSGEVLSIAISGNGTTIVDGTGTSINQEFVAIAANGHTGTLTFRNSASGSLGDVFIASADAAFGNLNIELGADVTVGELQIGTSTLAAVGTVNINGTSSSLTQSGNSPLTVGGSQGIGTINIGTTSDGGVLTTGTGYFYVLEKGTVNIGSGANTGRLEANATMAVDGGKLNVTAGSQFVLDDDARMIVQNGGRATLNGQYATAANATYDIYDSGSKLEIVGGNYLRIVRGAQINVTSRGHLAAEGGLSVGDDASYGTLIVDGTGSMATALVGTSYWGTDGGEANVIFRNQASGDFNTIVMAHDSADPAVANVTVESGADVTTNRLQMAVAGGPGTSATLTIDGPGSTVTVDSDLSIGRESIGSAVLNVRNGGSLVVGNLGTVLLPTGTINIEGGNANLGSISYRGRTINFSYGALNYLGDLNVAANGLLGSSLYLGTQHQLTLSGTTTVGALQTLGLYGGSLSTGSLVVNGTFDFVSGTLSITGASGLTIGASGPLGSTVILGAGKTVNVHHTATINSGAQLVLESGGTFNSSNSGTLVNNGTLVMDGVAAVLGGANVNNNGLIRGEGTITAHVTNAAAGEVRVQSGKTLTFRPNGTNEGTINLQGGTVDFSQGLINSPSGEIRGRGTFIAGGGGLANDGQVTFSSGVSDVIGNVDNSTGSINHGILISGNAEVTFWDDVTNSAGSQFRVATGSSATFFGTFDGAAITGGGDVHFESEVTPIPISPAYGGDVFFSGFSSLNIELGGTSPFQFDHVEVRGAATLEGQVSVSLINGFVPAVGDTFEILAANNGITYGEFASVLHPALPFGLGLNVSFSDFALTLSVIAVALPGDFNHDGAVDAADYVVWRKNPGGIYTPDDYNTWRSHFGQTFSFDGSGTGASAVAENVPEPTTIALLLFVAAGLRLRRGRTV